MTAFSPESSNPSPPQKRLRLVRRSLRVFAGVVGGLFTFAVLAAILLVATVNVDGVHHYLLGVARQKATAALGVPVNLQNFTVDIPRLRVDLYGITIDGAAPFPAPPLLRVNHIEASIRLVSIVHLKWYLNTLQIDHPVAWILAGENGKSNLPKVQGGTGKSQFNLFDLAIRHFHLNRGEIYFDDQPHSLNADLREFRLGAGYNSFENAYDGVIGYAGGSIKTGTVRPIPNQLEATFRLRPDAFYLNRAALTVGSSKIFLSGTLRNFGHPEVSAAYNAALDGAQLRSLLHNQDLPSGTVETRGSLTYHPLPSQSRLEALKVSGIATSNVLWLKTGSLSAPVRGLKCEYSYAGGIAAVKDLQAKLLGAEIEAEGMEKASGAHPHGTVNASARGLSLADIERALSNQSRRTPGLKGDMDATALASWGSSFKDLKARVDANLKGQAVPPGNHTALTSESDSAGASNGRADNSIVLVQGVIHATYTQENGRLQLENSYLQAPGTNLVVNGRAGKTSSLSVRLQSRDLGQLASLVSTFVPQGKGSGSPPLALSGEGSFEGSISGPIQNPQIRGDLAASDLRINGSHWKSIRAGVGLSSSGIQLENAVLQPASQGRVELNAKTGLDHWSFRRSNVVQASVTASNLKLADFLNLMTQPVPVEGTLNASVQMRGTLANPEGHGKVLLSNAKAYKQSIRSATASFSASGEEIKCDGSVEIAGGTIRASGNVQPGLRTFRGQIQSSGLRIEQLAYLKSGNVKAGGDLSLNVSGHGSFDNPEMSGAVRISQAAIEGRRLSSMDLQVSLASQILHVDLSSMLAEAPLKAQATIALTGNFPAKVSIDTGTLPVQPLLAIYAPDMADQVGGQAQVHLELHGPLKKRQAIVGNISVPILALSYGSKVKLAATVPIHADYQNGSLSVQPTTLQGTDTDLRLQGTVPIFSQVPMALHVVGSVDLQLAQLFVPSLQSSGSARIDIHSQNAESGGGLGGEIQIANANLSSTSFPTGLQNGNGVLTLNGNRIDISRFSGTIGGGTVSAQGGVTLQPKLGFDLGMTAKDVRVLYPQGVRESVNASLRFTGSTEQALLGGSVGITDVSFTPAFDLMSMVGQFSNGVSAPTAPGFTQNVAMNVSVHSTNNLSPSSRTMSVTGTTELFVRGTMAHPSIVGRANLTGGNMIFHGNRFVLTGGTIQFVNPNMIRPVLNVSLTTTIQQYDINLRFTGPADQLQGQFTSNPSLPRADVISLLAFGTTTEAQANNRTPANQEAESLIASQVSSQVTSRISKIAGISQLSISPVLTGGTAAGPPGAVITVRQQITGNLFVTFSTNVASTQSETVQGEYKLSPRVAVSATRDPNGGFAVDTLIRKSW